MVHHPRRVDIMFGYLTENLIITYTLL